MRDYYARLIPHLKGRRRDLALRKQNLGPYDRIFVREAGKFLNGYDMAASKEIAPHMMLPIWSPHGGRAWTVAPLAPLVTLRNLLRVDDLNTIVRMMHTIAESPAIRVPVCRRKRLGA